MTTDNHNSNDQINAAMEQLAKVAEIENKCKRIYYELTNNCNALQTLMEQLQALRQYNAMTLNSEQPSAYAVIADQLILKQFSIENTYTVNRVECVKAFRNMTGLGLRQSIAEIDAALDRYYNAKSANPKS